MEHVWRFQRLEKDSLTFQRDNRILQMFTLIQILIKKRSLNLLTSVNNTENQIKKKTNRKKIPNSETWTLGYKLVLNWKGTAMEPGNNLGMIYDENCDETGNKLGKNCVDWREKFSSTKTTKLVKH